MITSFIRPAFPGITGEIPKMTVTICTAQFTPAWEDPEGSLSHAAEYIRDAAKSGASLVCFPEQFATGWDPSSHAQVQGMDGEIVTTLQTLARIHHVAIIGSLREHHDPLPQNTSFVVDSGGTITARYAKCHLFSPGGEDRFYSPGDDIALFRQGDLTFGLGICYDLRFSPLFRTYARRGADAVIIPAAWPASRMHHWELLIRARALEHGLYIIGVNTTGKTKVDVYEGGSIIAGPDGEVIARGGAGEELICATLDRERVLQARNAPPPVEDDRREDLYHRLLKRTSPETQE